MRIIETLLYTWQVNPSTMMSFTLEAMCKDIAQLLIFRDVQHGEKRIYGSAD
jgi:hypothetical protein